MWILRCYATVFICVSSKVLAEYVIGNSLSWDAAKQSCPTHAVPDIMYTETESGVSVNISAIQSHTVETDETVWAGYIQAYQVFQYIGCVDLETSININKINWKTKHLILKGDIGQCSSVCKTTFFGIVRPYRALTACYCFKERLITPNDKEIYCNIACVTPKQTVCGGKKEHRTYVSLYEQVVDFSPITQTLGDESCVAISDKGELKMMDCRHELARICQNSYHDKANISTFKALTRWFDPDLSCFQDDKYPLSYTLHEDVSNLTTNEPLSWTGMLRSLVTYSYTDWGAKDIVKIGYTTYNKPGSNNLIFTNVNDGTKRKALCEHKELTTTPITQAKETTTVTSVIASASDGISNEQSTTDNTERLDVLGESKEVKSPEDGNSSALPIVAIAVGVIVAAAIAVTVFVIRKRRRQKPVRNGQSDDNNGEVCYDTATNELEDRTQTTNGQRYIPVKTHDEENTYDSASNENLNQSDNIYNHTNTHSKKNLTPIVDDTYNHINVTPKRSMNNEDETYDTTETSATGNAHSKLKTAGETENVYNTFENGEDSTYNSTTLQGLGHGNADDYDSCSNVVGAK